MTTSAINWACLDLSVGCIVGTEKMDNNQYFAYLETIKDISEDKKQIEIHKKLCGNISPSVALTGRCCNTNLNYTQTNKESDQLIKKGINGYYVCKCQNKICINNNCKDYTQPSYYDSCKLSEAVKDSTKSTETADFYPYNQCVKDCIFCS